MHHDNCQLSENIGHKHHTSSQFTQMWVWNFLLWMLRTILVKKSASGRRESAPQLHDWKKIWVILKPQNFHGSENFLEMILPLHISLEVLY